mmetsp:Transcript_54206/g.140000  ORF Transcript_54206/g.140000 Transcript_54206/m.140000 type:complete len:130 (-) Transcript_54206:148-537(-)
MLELQLLSSPYGNSILVVGHLIHLLCAWVEYVFYEKQVFKILQVLPLKWYHFQLLCSCYKCCGCCYLVRTVDGQQHTCGKEFACAEDLLHSKSKESTRPIILEMCSSKALDSCSIVMHECTGIRHSKQS